MIDMHVNGAAFSNIGITPGFLHKLTAAESSVAVGHQCDQQGKFLWGQADQMFSAVYLVGNKIDGNIFIRNDGVYGGTLLFIKLGCA